MNPSTAKRAAPRRASTDHVVHGNDKFVCLHCGRRQPIAFPIEISVFVAMSKAFVASHRRCRKPGGDPCAFCLGRGHDFMSCPDTTTVTAWRLCEDAGLSSKAILRASMGATSATDYPLDVWDFGRCFRLLKRWPEVSKGIEKLADVSPTWKRLAEVWSWLTELYEAGDRDGVGTRIREIVRGDR